MVPYRRPLDRVTVNVPCPASWDAMAGDGRVRFCAECRQNVYNLSDMTAAEAEELAGHTEGRLCVRFYRKPDGSVLTRDCIGSTRTRGRRPVTWLAGSAAALVACVAGLLVVMIGRGKPCEHDCHLYDRGPFDAIYDWLYPPPPPIMGMGAICPPPPPPLPPGGDDPMQ